MQKICYYFPEMAKQKDKQKFKKNEFLKNIKETKFFYDKVSKTQIKKSICF